MKEVSINKDMKLSEHFTLGELTKTSYITADGNIPSHKAIENLKNICENWLEDLRYSQNTLYGDRSQESGDSSQETVEMTFPSSSRAGIGAKRLIAFAEVRRVRIISLVVRWISSVMALSR